MMYVRCINNRGYEASLTMDSVYKVLPAPHDKTSWRVFDNEGEDYLYDTSRFEQVQVTGVHDKATENVTVHLAPLLKRILRAEALEYFPLRVGILFVVGPLGPIFIKKSEFYKPRRR